MPFSFKVYCVEIKLLYKLEGVNWMPPFSTEALKNPETWSLSVSQEEDAN